MRSLALLAGLSVVFAENECAEIEAAAKWGYSTHEEHVPPALWHCLPNNQACGTRAATETQSPIDIFYANERANSITMSYPQQAANTLTALNDGHSLKIQGFSADSILTTNIPGVSANTYQLGQFHFHWGDENREGSENLIKGKRFPLEAHFVHFPKNLYASVAEAAPHDLLVVGVLFELGTENNLLAQELVDLFLVASHDVNVAVPVTQPLNVPNLMPADVGTNFYNFRGSLTTPPCYATVQWVVAATPITISPLQLNLIRLTPTGNLDPERIEENYRPIQPVNDRPIWCSWTNCSFAGKESKEPASVGKAPEPAKKSKNTVPLVLGVSIPVGLVGVGGAAMVFSRRKRRQQHRSDRSSGPARATVQV